VLADLVGSVDEVIRVMTRGTLGSQLTQVYVLMAIDALPVGIAELQGQVAGPTGRGTVGSVQSESRVLVLESLADDGWLPTGWRMAEGAVVVEIAMWIWSGIRAG